MTDPSFPRTGGRPCRTGEINLALGVAHPSSKITIRGGQCPFPSSQNAHMPSETGTAGGWADDSPCRKKYFEKSFPQRLMVNLRSGRNDDEAQGGSDPSSLYY